MQANGSGSKSRKLPRGITRTHIQQINVLKVLGASTSPGDNSGRFFGIQEITRLAGMRDDDETKRYLYILEGHKLVAPNPPGDLTSTQWQILPLGVEAVKKLEAALLN